MANTDVKGEVLLQNYELQKKFNEFQRQINQQGGYPFDFKFLLIHLQRGIEGKFLEKVNSSEFFLKIKTLKIKRCKSFEINEDNIHQFFSPIYKREKGSYIATSSNFWNYFYGEKTEEIKDNFTSTIYLTQKRLSHQQILEEVEKVGIKKNYSFLEGLSIFRDAILAGEVDEYETQISIYFQMKEGGPLYCFSAYRFISGKFNLDCENICLNENLNKYAVVSFK